jgi:hypothetical protein
MGTNLSTGYPTYRFDIKNTLNYTNTMNGRGEEYINMKATAEAEARIEENRAGVERARDVFRKYVASDGLKPEFDGMSAWEIVLKIIKAYEIESSR